ncbi:hypothetical protein BpHYR1_012141 [Brachionus plicatilis]|uniref:Uncharacterized protein n=1 Tax=Brachionus plicatilis TaxID=10195 RepID=A0A3M7R890_BRAPC|nr:hypothetical protein BpHYR1_012141 [Brachionus plicatilis]
MNILNVVSSPSQPIPQLANSAQSWVTFANKNVKPYQRSHPIPAMSEYQINKKEALERKRNDEEEINKILEFINDGKKTEKTVIRFKPKSESDITTPILIKFNDEVTRNEILSKAKKLRIEKNEFQRIYLNPNLTIAQQHNHKCLREKWKEANINENDKRYIHVIRNNSQLYVINERSPDSPKSSQMQTNYTMSWKSPCLYEATQPQLTINRSKTQKEVHLNESIQSKYQTLNENTVKNSLKI